RWKGFDVKNIWHKLELGPQLPPVWDSMLAAYVINAGSIDSFDQVYKEHVGQALPDLLSTEQVLEYQIRLEPVLFEKLQKFSGESVLQNLELPLVPGLYDRERRGIGLDKSELSEFKVELQKELARLEKAILEESGESFNIARP